MRTSVNPGSRLEVIGHFNLHHYGGYVGDLDSTAEISLNQLLRQFAYDPNEDRTGWVRITIEPCDPVDVDTLPHSTDVKAWLESRGLTVVS